MKIIINNYIRVVKIFTSICKTLYMVIDIYLTHSMHIALTTIACKCLYSKNSITLIIVDGIS